MGIEVTTENPTVTHRRVTEKEWLKARNLSKNEWENSGEPMYLIAGGCVVFKGDKISDSWDGVDCQECLKTKAKP